MNWGRSIWGEHYVHLGPFCFLEASFLRQVPPRRRSMGQARHLRQPGAAHGRCHRLRGAGAGGVGRDRSGSGGKGPEARCRAAPQMPSGLSWGKNRIGRASFFGPVDLHGQKYGEKTSASFFGDWFRHVPPHCSRPPSHPPPSPPFPPEIGVSGARIPAEAKQAVPQRGGHAMIFGGQFQLKPFPPKRGATGCH